MDIERNKGKCKHSFKERDKKKKESTGWHHSPFSNTIVGLQEEECGKAWPGAFLDV